MKMVKIIALLIFTTTLALSFQNCSPTQNATLLGSKSSGISAAESVNISAPFAYDMVIDTISYNSCVGVGLNTSGIHGIKMGVNEGFVDSTGTVKGGLKLRTDFLNYIGKNVSPIYPSTVIAPSQVQYILQNSTANKNAHVQYAIRKKADLSVAVDVIQPNGTDAVVYQRDGLVEMASLASDPVLTALTKNVQFGANGVVLSEGPRIYNLYDPTAQPQAIQASFGYSNYTDETYPIGPDNPTTPLYENYGIGEAYSDRVRQRFNSTGSDKYVATVTYGDPTKGSADYGLSAPLRPLSSDNTRAYGRSYAFRFESPSTRVGWRSNQLKTVIETNLVDNTPVTGGASWSCENFFVMRAIEWNNARPELPSCAPLNSSDMQNANVAEKVKRLRRHYKPDEWDIGLFYPKNSLYAPGARTAQPLCLVPKKASCYLPTELNDTAKTDIGVNYDINSDCYQYAYSVMGITYSAGVAAARGYGRCAQYASICVR